MSLKKSMAVLSFLLGFSQAHATSGDGTLLSYEELQKLSPSARHQYMRGVQKIFGGLSESSDYFGMNQRLSRSVAAEAPVTSSQINTFIEQAEKWKDDSSTTPTERYKKAIYWVAATQIELKNVPDSDEGKAEAMARVKKINDYFTINRKEINADGKLDDPYVALLEANRGKKAMAFSDLKPYQSLESREKNKRIAKAAASEKPQTPAAKMSVSTAAPAAVPVTAPAAPTTTAPTAAPVVATVTPDAPVSAPTATVTTTGKKYRCMYAGFVLEKDPCSAPQSLPENMSLKGIDPEKMKCKESEALCNPLLFGVRVKCDFTKVPTANSEEGKKVLDECMKKASPICVIRSASATLNCSKQGSSLESLEAANMVITYNKEAWEQYRTSFYELCDDKMIELNEFPKTKNGKPRSDPERAMKDIEVTCDKAKAQLAKLKERVQGIEVERPTGKGKAPAKPATEGEQ